MSFYDLSTQERINVVAEISNAIAGELNTGKLKKTITYFDDNAVIGSIKKMGEVNPSIFLQQPCPN